MRALPLVVYALAVFAAAGAIAYPVWLALAWAGIDTVEFHRLGFRLLELCALIGLVPLLSALGGHGREQWGFAAGLGPAAGVSFVAGVARGFVAGAAMLGIVVAVLWGVGVRELRLPLDLAPLSVAGVVGGAVASAAVVSLVEEVWLRGALHGAVARMWNSAVAVIAVACLYGAIHFIRPDFRIEPDRIDWYSGYVLMIHAFDRFHDFGIVDSALALVTAGLVLGVVRARTGRIAECIGLHAGWVVVIKLARAHTALNPQSRWSILVGEYDGVLGWLACTMFATALLVTWLPARRLARQAVVRDP